MEASSNAIALKMFSTIKTNIGVGVVNGKSPDGKQVLVAFHREDLNKEWLEKHTKIKGNPILWIDVKDIQYDSGVSQGETHTQHTKRKKTK